MTLNELIKRVPEDLRDCELYVDVPCIRAGDEGDYPVFSMVIDQREIDYRIILDVKVY